MKADNRNNKNMYLHIITIYINHIMKEQKLFEDWNEVGEYSEWEKRSINSEIGKTSQRREPIVGVTSQTELPTTPW